MTHSFTHVNVYTHIDTDTYIYTHRHTHGTTQPHLYLCTTSDPEGNQSGGAKLTASATLKPVFNPEWNAPGKVTTKEPASCTSLGGMGHMLVCASVCE